MMMPLQRNLDWLSRYLFYSSAVHVPLGLRSEVMPTIDITQEWPDPPIARTNDVVNVAGSTSASWSVPTGRHWMLEEWSVTALWVGGDNLQWFVGTGAPATDTCLGFRTFAGGVEVVNMIPNRPLYLPPGAIAYFVTGSIAGGTTLQNRIWVRDHEERRPMLPLT